PVIVRGVGEGVGPLLVGSRHREVDVLPWQEGQFRAIRDLHANSHRGGRQPVKLHHGAGVAGSFGLGDIGRAGDLQYQVRTRLHAAGEYVPGGRLVRCQGVVDVGTTVVVARLAERFAGAAGAVATIEWDV